MTDNFAGARHNASDQKNVQMMHDNSKAMHDAAISLGADCSCSGSEKMTATPTPVDCYLIENFVATKPGEPYLWMPYGVIKKGDNTRNVTPELAAQFKLPHFKPPIKMGSHEDETPAGGHIVAFEIRADGIWVTPELVPNGEKVLAEGAYRYHSPEVIWEDGYIQDPTSGELIKGPFIMGDALLHTPHLGEKASLYTTERNLTMADNMISVPTSIWEKFMAMFDSKVNPPAEPPEVAQLKAQASEAEKYKAELETLKAQATKAQELTAIAASLQNKEQYGALFIDVKVAQTAAEHFAAMPAPTREWAQQQIRALVAQVDESKLLQKFGKDKQNAGGGTATEKFHAEVTRIATEKKLPYQQAVSVAAKEKPDLYEAYKNE